MVHVCGCGRELRSVVVKGKGPKFNKCSVRGRERKLAGESEQKLRKEYIIT